jgi:TIR domain
MSHNIFLSYRRDDAAHFAGRLVDSISRGLPGVKMFIDVDSISPGADFVKVMQEQLASCHAMILVIGPRWLGQGGRRRLDNPDDFVRLEIEAAINRKIPIVPVLVDGAAMPREDEIPASLHSITRRNYVRIDHENYSAVAPRLVSQLADPIGPSGKSASPARALIKTSLAEHYLVGVLALMALCIFISLLAIANARSAADVYLFSGGVVLAAIGGFAAWRRIQFLRSSR